MKFLADVQVLEVPGEPCFLSARFILSDSVFSLTPSVFSGQSWQQLVLSVLPPITRHLTYPHTMPGVAAAWLEMMRQYEDVLTDFIDGPYRGGKI